MLKQGLHSYTYMLQVYTPYLIWEQPCSCQLKQEITNFILLSPTQPRKQHNKPLLLNSKTNFPLKLKVNRSKNFHGILYSNFNVSNENLTNHPQSDLSTPKLLRPRWVFLKSHHFQVKSLLVNSRHFATNT